MGGCRTLEPRDFLQGSSSGNTLVWFVDLGDKTQNQAESWRIPPQGSLPSVGNSDEARNGKTAGLPTSGRNNGGLGNKGGRDIHPPPPEQHHLVYCDLSNNGVMYGGGTAAVSTCEMVVVGAGGYIHRPGGTKDSGKGDGGGYGGRCGDGSGGAEGRSGIGDKMGKQSRQGYTETKYNRDGA